jgi:hypothetical protein
MPKPLTVCELAPVPAQHVAEKEEHEARILFGRTQATSRSRRGRPHVGAVLCDDWLAALGKLTTKSRGRNGVLLAAGSWQEAGSLA